MGEEVTFVKDGTKAVVKGDTQLVEIELLIFRLYEVLNLKN